MVPESNRVRAAATMKVALLVIGNGRLQYLHRVVDAALEHLPEFDYYCMIDDSGDPSVGRELMRNYPDFLLWASPQNTGMAKAVQAGFQLICELGCDYVFWLEEDMLITRPIPFDLAVNALIWEPHIAQMLFQRQPIAEAEIAAGSVIGAMGDVTERYGFYEQTHIFSLNPCLIPRNVLELGWDPDNEAGMTKKLLDHGFTFGVWDGQYVEHIGVERGKQWQL